MFSFFGGGHGGYLEGDGFNYGNVFIFMVMILLVEIFEVVYFMFFCFWVLCVDFGGLGWYWGGLGAFYEIELLEENVDVFLFGEWGWFVL